MIRFPPGLVYIASPYSHKEHNVRRCRYETMADFMALTVTNPAFADCVPYSPIVAWHTAALRNGLPKAESFWHEQNSRVIRLAVDFVIVTLDGWEESRGIRAEIDMFAVKGIQPIMAHFSPNGDIELWIR